jgi:hypothetical protein
MIDELINENTIRNNKIQFIFEKNIRLEIDSIVVLSEMKNFRKIVYRCKFDNDHVDEQIENLLHKRFNKSKKRWIWFEEFDWSMWIHFNSWYATSSLWTTLMLELNDEWFLIKSYLKILYKCFSSHFTCWISRSHVTWSIHHIIIKCHQIKT